MTYRTKYVIIDTGMFVIPVLFSELQSHSEVVAAFNRKPSDVLGAGFCHVEVVQIVPNYPEPRYKCYGESISLRVKSREDLDSKFINKYLGVTHDD